MWEPRLDNIFLLWLWIWLITIDSKFNSDYNITNSLYMVCQGRKRPKLRTEYSNWPAKKSIGFWQAMLHFNKSILIQIKTSKSFKLRTSILLIENRHTKSLVKPINVRWTIMDLLTYKWKCLQKPYHNKFSCCVNQIRFLAAQ